MTIQKLLLALIVSIVFSGCASLRPIVLHPIEKADIFQIVKGSKVTAPDGTVIAVEKDGRFLSDYYLEQVAKARMAQ
jgi:hypothetical protein